MEVPTLIHVNPDRLKRRLATINLQEIEGNPFTLGDHIIFEMLDRNGWSNIQRREYQIREAQLREEISATIKLNGEG